MSLKECASLQLPKRKIAKKSFSGTKYQSASSILRLSDVSKMSINYKIVEDDYENEQNL